MSRGNRMWSKYWGFDYLSIILIITADPLGEEGVRCGAKEEWRTMIQDSTTEKCKKSSQRKRWWRSIDFFLIQRKIIQMDFFLDLSGFKRELTEDGKHPMAGRVLCHIFTFKKVISMSFEFSLIRLSGHFSGWWSIKLRWTLKFWIDVKSCTICVYSNIQTWQGLHSDYPSMIILNTSC